MESNGVLPNSHGTPYEFRRNPLEFRRIPMETHRNSAGILGNSGENARIPAVFLRDSAGIPGAPAEFRMNSRRNSIRIPRKSCGGPSIPHEFLRNSTGFPVESCGIQAGSYGIPPEFHVGAQEFLEFLYDFNGILMEFQRDSVEFHWNSRAPAFLEFEILKIFSSFFLKSGI